MIKTRDVPVELRDFNKVFNELAYYEDHSRIFDRFLDYTMAMFMFPEYRDMDYLRSIRDNTEGGFDRYWQLMKELIKVLDKQITDQKGSWYDPLGDFYMIQSSRSKASAFGQFFTPEPICDLMTRMQYKDCEAKGLRIYDPTCGSGRFLLAFHAHYPGNFTFGDDLDSMCARMSVINMCMHGCQGQVNHMNTISLEWIRGWRINPYIQQLKVPHIIPMRSKEEALTMQQFERRKTDKPEHKPEEHSKEPDQRIGQLTLF